MSYGNRVRFVIRNFPLTQVHANAFHAAQAAEAAKAQGKFWEYIDFMFKNQTALDDDSLKKYATQVGLDRKRFDAELEAGKYDPSFAATWKTARCMGSRRRQPSLSMARYSPTIRPMVCARRSRRHSRAQRNGHLKEWSASIPSLAGFFCWCWSLPVLCLLTHWVNRKNHPSSSHNPMT